MPKTNSEEFDTLDTLRKVAGVLWAMGTLLLVTIAVLDFVRRFVPDDEPDEEVLSAPMPTPKQKPCDCE